MRNYKDATDSNEIARLVSKKLKVKIAPLTSYKQDERKIYQIPFGSASIDDGNQITNYVYCKDREICKKIYTFLKKEGYYVKWLRAFGGHKIFMLAKEPTKSYKEYGQYC